MKKFNSNKKAKAFTVKGAAALIIAAILALVFTGCPNNAGGSGSGSATPPVPPTPTPKPKHAIAFSVDSTTPNGTLKAKADDVPETEASPITVEEGKTVTFTAKAHGGYRVKGWTLDGNAVNGTNSSYSFPVTKAAEVKVSFENTPLPQYAVTFSVEGGNGTLKAKADGVPETEASPITVEEGKTITFTATEAAGYEVKEWKVDGTVVTGNTSNTYTCTVTKALHVTVSFEPDVGSVEDTGDGFVKIIPPANSIVGVDPDYTLPGNQAWWKGVFRAGRKVKLSPYKLGKTEVTYKLWKEVYDWATGHGYTFANPGVKGKDGSGTDDEPVTTISWRDCIVWCNAYTHKTNNADTECVYRKKDDHTVVLKDATATAACDAAYADMSKKGFRLPTEAEWEYAARWQGNNTENAAQYGDVWLTKLNSASGAKDKWDTAETGEVAWYDGNSGSKTHPVGEKRENALGLHDMSGNVWEWCFDWYGDIEANTVTDPQGGASGTNRVFRGGSWDSDAYDCTVGSRNYRSPDYSYYFLGFRLACLP